MASEAYKPLEAEPDYRHIQTAKEFTALVDMYIARGEIFGFDIESGFTGDPDLDKIALKTKHPRWILVGFSLAIDEYSAFYVPIAHDDETQNVDDPKQVARDLWRLLQTGMSVPFNAAFELKGTGRWFQDILGDDPELGPEVTKDYGIFPVHGDAQLLGFVADLYYGKRLTSKDGVVGGGPAVGKDLKSVVEINYGHRMTHFAELFTEMNLKKASHQRFNMLPVSKQVVDYACEDSLWCLKLFKDIHKEIEENLDDEPYDDRAYQVEIELLPVVARMDQVGLPLDWEYVRLKLTEAEQLRDEMNEEIQNDIAKALGETEILNVNLASPKQVAEVLYDKLGVPRPKERGKEVNSTSEKALQSISKSNDIVRKILTYRTVVKMIGSYLKKYLTDLDYRGDGRAYPSHNQTGAISGRFSVEGMSYQQLPKPYHYQLNNGRNYHLAFREIIQAPKGSRIVGFDYSQIQLRMMAGFAQEKTMISAFSRGTDIHVATASAMLGVPEDKITGKQRSTGKTLNFGIVFQQGPDALAESLTTPEAPVTTAGAAKLLEQYFDGYPDLRSWMNDMQAKAGRGEFVYGLLGRRYRIWEHQSDLAGVRSKGDRTAINEPIQGAEAIYAKMAMVRADKRIRDLGLQDKIQLVIMVHDALEFFVHESISTQEVIDILGDAVSFPIPGHPEFPEIAADWHEGPNLGALVEISLDANKKIQKYEMKMEVSGTPTVSWEGDTFEEVFNQYYRWRMNVHPEYNSEEVVEEEEEAESRHFEVQVNSEISRDNLIRALQFIQQLPGNNTVTLIVGGVKYDISDLCGVDLTHQANFNMIFGNVTMYEVKPEVIEEEEEHPF